MFFFSVATFSLRKKGGKSRSLSWNIKLEEIGQTPFFIYYCHHLWPSNEGSCWSTMHITHQCLIKHIGSPLPMNWLFNFPHGHNIITRSLSSSVSWVHFVIGLTSDLWSKGQGCKLKTLLFSNPVFSAVRADTVKAISNYNNPPDMICKDIFSECTLCKICDWISQF